MRQTVTLVAVLAVFFAASACSSVGSQSAPVFDFASDDLCEWVSPDDVDRIVADAYSSHGAGPIPADFELGAASVTATSGCHWIVPESSGVGLMSVGRSGTRSFEPHPGLSDGVSVAGPLDVGSHDDWVPGIEVRIEVDGWDEELEFWHQVPPGFEGDVDALLAIVDGLLVEMGWVESN